MARGLRPTAWYWRRIPSCSMTWRRMPPRRPRRTGAIWLLGSWTAVLHAATSLASGNPARALWLWLRVRVEPVDHPGAEIRSQIGRMAGAVHRPELDVDSRRTPTVRLDASLAAGDGGVDVERDTRRTQWARAGIVARPRRDGVVGGWPGLHASDERTAVVGDDVVAIAVQLDHRDG